MATSLMPRIVAVSSSVRDGRIGYGLVDQISRERTRADSLASIAARGRPTVSDLLVTVNHCNGRVDNRTNLLITVMISPFSLCPAGAEASYTPSRDSKMRSTTRGVQG